MRMDPSTQTQTAAEIVNTYNAADLTRIIRAYSDEKWASRIADFIVREREKEPFETSGQLVEVIKAAIPASARRAGGHPAKRTFQALRIDVNREFEVLYEFMEKLPGALKPGGRAAILTFHSGEDRLVKKTFQQFYREGVYQDIAKDVIRPSQEECIQNSRARSTKLRWAIRAGE